MVSLRLLALPAELRRRHRRPFDLPDRRGRAERRRGDCVRRMVADAVHRTAMRPAPARTRADRDTGFIDGKYAFAVERQLGRRAATLEAALTTSCSCRRPTSATARTSVPPRGSSVSRPPASTPRVRPRSSSSPCRTSTWPPSPTASASSRRPPCRCGHDRELRRRRPAGGVLRPVRRPGAGSSGDARATWWRPRCSRRRWPTSPTAPTWPTRSMRRSTRSTPTSRSNSGYGH